MLRSGLALRDDEGDLIIELSAGSGIVRAAIGPFEPDALHAGEASDGGLYLERVLETVCDTHEFESREDGAWIELTKLTASVGAA